MTNLPLKVYYSNLNNGVMKFGISHVLNEGVVKNREKFLQKAGISLKDTTLCKITYGKDIRYNRIVDVGGNDKGKGMRDESAPVITDALFTKSKYHGLFLPIADCAGVTVYDAKRKVLGLLHLGRHATFDGLVGKAIQHMAQTYGTRAKDVFISISPSITGESYWLHTFDRAHEPAWQPHVRAHDDGCFIDLQGYNIDRFIEAGVPKNQIERSPINTATDPDYPSHYAFETLGQLEKAGRFAVVAYMMA